MQSRGAIVRFRRVASVAGILAITLLPLSCGKQQDKSGPRYNVFPVQGEIFINGKPGVGVEVTLHPTTELPQLSTSRAAVVPVGNVDTDGVYKISTYTAFDGAPVGKYNISLFAKSKGAGGFSKGDENVTDRFEGKYKDAAENAKNDPEHFTVEVKEVEGGPNAVPAKVPRLDIDWPDFWPPEEEKEKK